MAIAADREGIQFDSAHFVVEKHMQTNPRRIARLPVRIQMPAGLTHDQRTFLEGVARTCPVERSISADVEREFIFDYGEESAE
jgi:hypothetical protein